MIILQDINYCLIELNQYFIMLRMIIGIVFGGGDAMLFSSIRNLSSDSDCLSLLSVI
jgi:hypothetical protein